MSRRVIPNGQHRPGDIPESFNQCHGKTKKRADCLEAATIHRRGRWWCHHHAPPLVRVSCVPEDAAGPGMRLRVEEG